MIASVSWRASFIACSKLVCLSTSIFQVQRQKESDIAAVTRTLDTTNAALDQSKEALSRTAASLKVQYDINRSSNLKT